MPFDFDECPGPILQRKRQSMEASQNEFGPLSGDSNADYNQEIQQADTIHEPFAEKPISTITEADTPEEHRWYDSYSDHDWSDYLPENIIRNHESYSTAFQERVDFYKEEEQNHLEDLKHELAISENNLYDHMGNRPSTLMNIITIGDAASEWKESLQTLSNEVRDNYARVQQQEQYCKSNHIIDSDARVFAANRMDNEWTWLHDAQEPHRIALRSEGKEPIDFYTELLDEFRQEYFTELAEQRLEVHFFLSDISESIDQHQQGKPSTIENILGGGKPMREWIEKNLNLQSQQQYLTDEMAELDTKRAVAPESDTVTNWTKELLAKRFPEVVEAYQVAMQEKWDRIKNERLEIARSTDHDPERDHDRKTIAEDRTDASLAMEKGGMIR